MFSRTMDIPMAIGNNADADDDNDGFTDAEETNMGSDPVDASSDPERDALVAFYQATNGANWTNNGSWLVEADACSWFGVTCDSNGRVTQLSMWSNNVDGPLPETIGNLRSLEVISLADNSLSGSIPETIGELDNLRRLTLWANQLSGVLPDSLGNLDNLSNFRLP